MTQLYTVTHITGNLSTTIGQDLLAILASSQSRVRLHKLEISMLSSDVEAVQALGVELFRGSTSTPGSTSTLTPIPIDGHAGQRAPVTVVNQNDVAAMSTASAARLWCGTMADGKFCFEPGPCAVPSINPSQRFHARLTQPSAAAAFHIAAVIEESGVNPV